MKVHTLPFILLFIIAIQVSGQEAKGPFSNERLKMSALPDRAITGNSSFLIVNGMWVPESKDSSKALVFPQQVKIQCRNYRTDDRGCRETIVTLAPVAGVMVSIQDIDTEEYDIDTWDAHGLIASYGGGLASPCQRHVLTMNFESGAVSVSDIPTHNKGCAFQETNSYRLVRGTYYVDTSPNNDMDKPVKSKNK